MYITQNPITLDYFFSVSPGNSCGAMASFVGLVRNHDEGKAVKRLYYECYFPMAEKMIENLITQAHNKWKLNEIRVLHRVGQLAIGEIAVAIAVGSAHREEAFESCRFLIERIKHEVPIWKKQIFEDGESEWVSCDHYAGTIL